MRVDYLACVASVLRDVNIVKPEEFDMREWECGTVACAIGHACRIPAIAAAGLTMQYSSIANRVTSDGSPIAVPCFETFTGFNAVEQFFELGVKDSDYLFHGHTYPSISKPTPIDVANRIDELIARAMLTI